MVDDYGTTLVARHLSSRKKDNFIVMICFSRKVIFWKILGKDWGFLLVKLKTSNSRHWRRRFCVFNFFGTTTYLLIATKFQVVGFVRQLVLLESNKSYYGMLPVRVPVTYCAVAIDPFHRCRTWSGTKRSIPKSTRDKSVERQCLVQVDTTPYNNTAKPLNLVYRLTRKVTQSLASACRTKTLAWHTRTGLLPRIQSLLLSRWRCVACATNLFHHHQHGQGALPLPLSTFPV